MVANADSHSLFTPERIWSQHQAVLTLINGALADPKRDAFSWLDLGCGKGQIIAQVQENVFSPNLRRKITYLGFDIEQNDARNTIVTAAKNELKDASVTIGDMADFPKLIDATKHFNLITITNTLHELRPRDLCSVLFEAAMRLMPDGVLYVYDMEALTPPELGAVTWNARDVSAIFLAIFGETGIKEDSLGLQRWLHSTTTGWSVQLTRANLLVDDNALAKLHDSAIHAGSDATKKIVTSKLADAERALEAITLARTELSEEEQESEQRNLRSFWSLSRALREFK